LSTILVVEDEKNLREFYRIELTREGYEVLTACTGKEAMEVLERRIPDAVIMDIRMPDMDGIEALGKMVARHKNIPIILNTAYSSYRDDFRTWAAEAYVVKSSDLTSLKRTLRSVLKKASQDQ
jgi:DNA-binding response OmpR family regulator